MTPRIGRAPRVLHDGPPAASVDLKVIRVNLGSGRTKREGYLNVDLRGGDLLAGDLIAGQATRTPLVPAVSSTAGTWSYAELIRRSRTVAARLRHCGVTSDSRIAISAESSVDLVVSVLGVWLAGHRGPASQPHHVA